MPSTLVGRELVKKYLEDNNISNESLGAMYGYSKVYVGEVLNGNKTGPNANNLILKIINDLKIRKEVR